MLILFFINAALLSVVTNILVLANPVCGQCDRLNLKSSLLV